MPSVNTEKDRRSTLFGSRRKNYFSKDTFGRKISENSQLPNVKMTETPKSFHFEFKIPGYIKEDFNFYISGGDLIVTTDKSKNSGNSRSTGHSYCYPSALFKKRINIPEGVNKRMISVDYVNEVLSFDLFKIVN